MNLSKQATMLILEDLISLYECCEGMADEKSLLGLAAEILCFQHHLKKFV